MLECLALYCFIVIPNPISHHLLSPSVLNPPRFVWGRWVCSQGQGPVGWCCAELLGSPSWRMPPGQAALPRPLLPPHRPVSSATQRRQTTAAVPSTHLKIMRVYYRSTLPLSFPRPLILIATPHPFQCEDLFIFNHKQTRHTYRAPVLLAATSPGTSPLPIYSIWC